MAVITETFRRTIIETFHEEGAAWLEQLSDRISQYEARWSIKVFDPYLLSFSYCAPALTMHGQEVVFKLAVPSKDFTHQVQALRYFNGHGMVKLLDADSEHGALLLERLTPGEMLVNAVTDDEQTTQIAANVMQSLWLPAPTDNSFPSMVDWAQNFKNIHSFYTNGICPLPFKTVERTENLFAELFASQGSQVLLHGDLHHFNILSVIDKNGLSWRAIDPFGVTGEREVEVGAFVRNPNLTVPIEPALKQRLKRRFDIFHEQLGLDLQRMIAWASVYAAVSAWWTISDGADGWQVDAALSDLFAGMLS